MKTLNIFNHKMKPLMMFITVILLILVGVFHYIFFHHEADLITAQSIEMEKAYKESQWADIEAAIDLSTRMARVSAKETARDMVNDIHDKYPDLKELSDEFDKGNYTSPKFIELILANIKDKYMYDIHNTNNDIFVISRIGIIADTNLNGFESIHRTFQDEAKHQYNVELMYNAISALLENDNDELIFYEPKVFDETDEGHNLVTNPSKHALKDIFFKEGLKGIAGYTVLVPAYVTEDGDVFGTPDISPDGNKNINHKFIVVQRYNIYDLIEEVEPEFNVKEKAYVNARNNLVNIMKFSAVSYLAIALLDIIALLFLIMYATGHKKESDI